MDLSEAYSTAYVDDGWDHEKDWAQVSRLFRLADLADRLFNESIDREYEGTRGMIRRHTQDSEYRRKQADVWRNRYRLAYDQYYKDADRYNMVIQTVVRDYDGRVITNSWERVA